MSTRTLGSIGTVTWARAIPVEDALESTKGRRGHRTALAVVGGALAAILCCWAVLRVAAPDRRRPSEGAHA